MALSVIWEFFLWVSVQQGPYYLGYLYYYIKAPDVWKLPCCLLEPRFRAGLPGVERKLSHVVARSQVLLGSISSGLGISGSSRACCVHLE